MQSLYVYYKVRSEHGAALRRDLIALQAALQPQASQRFSFCRRVESRVTDEQTWMEIYENVTPEFIVELDQAIRQAALMQWISGLRHVEIFEAGFDDEVNKSSTKTVRPE